MRRFTALFLALVLPFAAAQTVTTTDAAGETIVENITEDVNGNPTTVILQTLVPAVQTQTVTTTDVAGDTIIEVILGNGQGDSLTQTIQTIPAAAQNPAGGGQGPVGQPGPTGAAGAPTPFTYTTTDAAGNTKQVVAVFTPSFPATVSPTQTFQATVLDYSQYTASYVTAAQAAANNQQNGALQRSAGWWGPCLSVLVGVAGGFVLLLGA